jgi:ABC-type hemin transport system ATPase subunit
MNFVTDLDTRLLKLGPGSYHTLRMALENVHAFGATGAGKSSAFKTLASAYLRTGAGMVICVTKPDEVERWVSYACANGREKHVVLFTEQKGFNFIAWELARQGVKGVGSVVECLMRVLDAADAAVGVSGQSNDPFWSSAIRQLLGIRPVRPVTDEIGCGA